MAKKYLVLNNNYLNDMKQQPCTAHTLQIGQIKWSNHLVLLFQSNIFKQDIVEHAKYF